MKNLWTHHLKYYDFFQNNLNGYVKTLDIHLRELRGFNHILDTGAGSGNLTLQLLKKVHKVVAVDTNEFSLRLLKEKCKIFDNLEIINMDVQKLDFKNTSFDAVVSMFVIPFVKDNERYFKEVYRVLRKNGKFTISAWAPVKDSMNLMCIASEELTLKKILPKHKKEWDYIMESTKINAQTVSNGPSKEEIVRLLNKAGFVNIEILEDKPYGNYSYFITCIK